MFNPCIISRNRCADLERPLLCSYVASDSYVEYILFIHMLLLYKCINCSICYEDIVSNELDTLQTTQEAKL